MHQTTEPRSRAKRLEQQILSSKAQRDGSREPPTHRTAPTAVRHLGDMGGRDPPTRGFKLEEGVESEADDAQVQEKFDAFRMGGSVPEQLELYKDCSESDILLSVLMSQEDTTATTPFTRACYVREVQLRWIKHTHIREGPTRAAPAAMRAINEMDFPFGLASEQGEAQADTWISFRPSFMIALMESLVQGCPWPDTVRRLLARAARPQESGGNVRLTSHLRRAMRSSQLLQCGVLHAEVIVYLLDESYVGTDMSGAFGRNVNSADWEDLTKLPAGQDCVSMAHEVVEAYIKKSEDPTLTAVNVYERVGPTRDIHAKIAALLHADEGDAARGAVMYEAFHMEAARVDNQVKRGLAERSELNGAKIIRDVVNPARTLYEKQHPSRPSTQRTPHGSTQRPGASAVPPHRRNQDASLQSPTRIREPRARSNPPRSHQEATGFDRNGAPRNSRYRSQYDQALQKNDMAWAQRIVNAVQVLDQSNSNQQQTTAPTPTVNAVSPSSSQPPPPQRQPMKGGGKGGDRFQYGGRGGGRGQDYATPGTAIPPPPQYSSADVVSIPPPSGSTGHPEGLQWTDSDWKDTKIDFDRIDEIAASAAGASTRKLRPADAGMTATKMGRPVILSSSPVRWGDDACAYCKFRPLAPPNTPLSQLHLFGTGSGAHNPYRCERAKKFAAEGGESSDAANAKHLQTCIRIVRARK